MRYMSFLIPIFIMTLCWGCGASTVVFQSGPEEPAEKLVWQDVDGRPSLVRPETAFRGSMTVRDLSETMTSHEEDDHSSAPKHIPGAGWSGLRQVHAWRTS